MTDNLPLPPDDLARTLTVSDPNDPMLPHLFLAGGIYTILISGKETDGHYCLIDMLVAAGGGPPAHRHDFEEMFTLLEGELDFTFRGKTQTVKAPMMVNIPANAPHQFKNNSGRTAHMLCLCTPAGQEEFFEAVGIGVDSRSSPTSEPSQEEMAAKLKLAVELSPRYRTEILENG